MNTDNNKQMNYSINNYLDAFESKMKLGMSAIRDAAKQYVEALGKYSFAQKKFEERFPEIKKDTWSRLKDIGNDKLIPEAMLFRPVAAQIYRALPIRSQKTIAKSKGVEVAAEAGKSFVIPYGQLSDRQCAIVIDEKKGEVRSIEEQRKIIAKTIRPKKIRTPRKPYVIKGDTVEFVAYAVLTAEDLKRILREMGEL